MQIKILAEAIDDLHRVEAFYDSQQRGLGSRVLDWLLGDIERLTVHAGIHTRIFGYYRLLAKRVPYAVYYDVKDGIVKIYAVLDCRQSPSRTARQSSIRR